jgi:hypothetical protein
VTAHTKSLGKNWTGLKVSLSLNVRGPRTDRRATMVPVEIELTALHLEVLAAHGPYKLREDGVIEDADGASLTNCRPNPNAEECEWDRALVAVLNAIHAAASVSQ